MYNAEALRFTGKEVDQETGLYYYGARYLDPKYSMWISTDPALGEYIPEMGKGNAKDSGSLPGMGGVYNHINFHLYHYAGNNPVRFVDPDGRKSLPFLSGLRGAYDAVPLVHEVSTGNDIADNIIAGVASVYNTLAAVVNGATNLIGDIFYWADQGLNWLDNNWDSNWTLTGYGIKADLDAWAFISGASPQLFAEADLSIQCTVQYLGLGKIPLLKNGDTVYRVYGGDSAPDGASWTTVKPSQVKNFRDKAGLPSGKESGVINSGRFVITGTVTDSSKCVKSRRALPLDGNKGGLTEYIIPNPFESGAIKVQNVQGITPEL